MVYNETERERELRVKGRDVINEREIVLSEKASCGSRVEELKTETMEDKGWGSTPVEFPLSLYDSVRADVSFRSWLVCGCHIGSRAAFSFVIF